jgi:hypothetical protein
MLLATLQFQYKIVTFLFFIYRTEYDRLMKGLQAQTVHSA